MDVNIEHIDDDPVDVIDEDDVVIATVPRHEMRAKVLRHRAVFVVVVNDDGEILVHRRSRDKDIWPGWLDLAVGGVLAKGESYEGGARREVFEEIGVDDPRLEVFDEGVPRAYDDESVSLLGRCFLLRHPGPFVFRDGEIEQAWWVPIRDLEDMVCNETFLPDSRVLLLERVLDLLD